MSLWLPPGVRKATPVHKHVGAGAGVARAASGGGEPPAFSLEDVGFQVLLQGTGLAGADGAAVTTWTNEGEGAAIYTQAAADLRPTKKTGILNGKDVCRFPDAVWDRQLVAGDLSALFPTAATLFVVYAPTTTDIFTVYKAGAEDSYTSFGGTGYMGTFRATRIDGYPGVMPTTGAHRMAVRSSASNYEVFVDGASAGVRAANYAAGTDHVLGSGASRYVGDIALVAIADSALSDDTMDAVDEFLVTEFAL